MNSKRALQLTVGALLGIGMLLMVLSPQDNRFPPPVQVTLAHSNAPVRVFPGVTGVFFILPDGSLWRWGQTGGQAFSRARVPEPVGTNTDWVEALAANNHCLGLRRDGTVWEWGWRGAKYATTPEPAGPGTNWVGIAAGDVHSLALNRDGTLWAWGDNASGQLGISGPSRTEMAQVGTETNWMAVSCGQGSLTCALKQDGSLWIWGTDFTSLFPQPFQALAETNWVHFETEMVLRVRNRQGELWQPFRFRPGLPVNAPTAGFLITTNVAGRCAQAYCGQIKKFEVRADGTLWEAPLAFRPPTASAPAARLPGPWQRVGQRTDWVGIWGTGTAIGLTADGTLWAWGSDPGLEPILDLPSRWRVLQNRVLGWLGMGSGTLTTMARPQYRKQPTPLMKLHVTNSVRASMPVPKERRILARDKVPGQ